MTISKNRVPRLYLERDLQGAALTLSEREAHYLGHVLRLRHGDRLVAFNGRGTERQASVLELNRRHAQLELEEHTRALPESLLAITLVQALAKAEPMDLVVQKATELGVRRIVPIYTDFSVVKLDAERSERRLAHWKRVAQSACEQCGRHAPPEIEPPQALAALLATSRHEAMELVLDPSSSARLAHVAPMPTAVTFVVGPEGGFSAAELERIDRAGFRRIGLGPRVLRTETAAIAACAAAQSLWGEL
jgi:16S rRNA (uracil1498-N3)-methyltransferase